ncbi:hypothetical protein PENTCL1PPCAC_23552, partial [Pristionchus entomophagus]
HLRSPYRLGWHGRGDSTPGNGSGNCQMSIVRTTLSPKNNKRILRLFNNLFFGLILSIYYFCGFLTPAILESF